jgi:hypothetical protein
VLETPHRPDLSRRLFMQRSSIFVPLLSAALLLLSSVDARAQLGIASGRIVDENKEGVEGVSVSFDFQEGVNRLYEAKTDENGEYQQIDVEGAVAHLERYLTTAPEDSSEQ